MKSARSNAAQGSYSAQRNSAQVYYPRNHLISRMLRNRGVLRILIAPTGFGKSMLAIEYVRRVFQGNGVLWVDGKDPQLICNLDEGNFPPSEANPEQPLRALVIEDLPPLDDIRSKSLSKAIDHLLHSHVEVIISTLPSNDSLQKLQPDRIALMPRDFLLGSMEVAATTELIGEPVPSNEYLSQLLGIPSLVWGNALEASITCIKGFFDEALPEDFSLPALAMILLERGRLDDISLIGIPFAKETREIIASMYPLFGIDCLRGTFASIPIGIDSLSFFDNSSLISWDAQNTMFLGAADCLIARCNYERAGAIIRCFCPLPQRLAWLKQHGWELIDRCQSQLLFDMLNDCLPGTSKLVEHQQTSFLASADTDEELMILFGWSAYLAGKQERAQSIFASIKAMTITSLPCAIAAALLGASLEGDIRWNPWFKRMYNLIPGAANLGLSACSLRCVSCLEDENAPVCCPRQDDNLVLCARWAILLRTVMMQAGEQLPPLAGLADCENVPTMMVRFLAQVPSLHATTAYRFALHGLIARISLLSDDDRLTLTTLFVKAVAPLLTRSVDRLSEAMLILDYDRLGYLINEDIRSPDKAQGIVAQSRTILLAQARVFEHAIASGQANEHKLRHGILHELMLIAGISDVRVDAFDNNRQDEAKPMDILGKNAEVQPINASSCKCNGADMPQKNALEKPRKKKDGAIQGRLVKDDSPPNQKITPTVLQEEPHLYVRLFGGFDIYLGGQRLDSEVWRKKKVRLLIAYLVLYRGREASRANLLAELWPKLDSIHARDNFYVVWSLIKKELADKDGKLLFFERNDITCRVNRSYVFSDVYEFEEKSRGILVGRDNTSRLMEYFIDMESLYQGDLLSGDFCGGYFETLKIWYREMFVDAMVGAAERAADTGDGWMSMWFARKAFEYGIAREDVYRALMHAQIISGQRTSAIETYESCKEYLAGELGIAPSHKTLQMYEDALIAKPLPSF